MGCLIVKYRSGTYELMKLRRLLTLLLIGTLGSSLSGQVSDKDLHEFAVQVKQVDEFIERFNGDTTTLLYEYTQKHFPDEQLDRKSMIGTLFNKERRDWDREKIRQFLNKVSQPAAPIYLSYYDDDWYAVIDCNVRYEGKIERAYITLAVQKGKDYSAKWVTRGVHANFLQLLGEDSEENFLNPVSHGTDFINLKQMFKSDKRYLRSYLYKDFSSGGLPLFINELIEGKIEFEGINSISYHFLQIDDWVFIVSKYLRESANSGWLISDLQPLSKIQKEQYKERILHLD